MDKWDWEKMIASENGPKSPTTRLILLTLGVFMDGNCENCFPSTKKLAAASGLSERCACEHLGKAVAEGWIRKIKNSGSGQAWKHNSYEAVIPGKALTESQHVKKERTDGGSAPYTKGTDSHAEGTDFHDIKALTESQSTIPYTRPKNTPQDANSIYAFFVSEIQPVRRSKTRAVKNIAKYLKRGVIPETLKAAVLNYKTTLNGTDPKYRKDPANFFGINEPYAIDFYPENFRPQQEQEKSRPPIEEFDFENQFHEE